MLFLIHWNLSGYHCNILQKRNGTQCKKWRIWEGQKLNRSNGQQGTYEGIGWCPEKKSAIIIEHFDLDFNLGPNQGHFEK